MHVQDFFTHSKLESLHTRSQYYTRITRVCITLYPLDLFSSLHERMFVV